MLESYATAPAVLKLYGEHAVVHGKLAAAIAVKLYAKASISESDSDSMQINLKSLNQRSSFSEGNITKLFQEYRKSEEKGKDGKDSIGAYVDKCIKDGISKDLLPYVIIAGRVMHDYSVKLSGISIEIESGIPISKGFASSAACSTAFAAALAKSRGITVPDNELIDIARDGERIVHKNCNAGKIDVNTSFYGGCILYSDSTGVARERLPEGIQLLAIDTGPKRPTSETVGNVTHKLETDREGTLSRFDQIEGCTKLGIEALKRNDLKTAGELMYKDQELLKELGVSSPSLDTAISIAKESGAYGAKLSGGGGGGVAIAISSNPKALIDRFKSIGFKTSLVDLCSEGCTVSNSKMREKRNA